MWCDHVHPLPSLTDSHSSWHPSSFQPVLLPFLCGWVSIGLIQATTAALCSCLLRPPHIKETAFHNSLPPSSCSTILLPSAMSPGESAIDVILRWALSTTFSQHWLLMNLLWTLPIILWSFSDHFFLETAVHTLCEGSEPWSFQKATAGVQMGHNNDQSKKGSSQTERSRLSVECWDNLLGMLQPSSCCSNSRKREKGIPKALCQRGR